MGVTVQDISDARERRAVRQQELLKAYGHPLICFTMNIPGPEKRSDLIDRGFSIGLAQLRAQLAGEAVPVLFREETREITGCTAYLAVDCDPRRLKRLTVEVEDGTPLGRLFDMDVIAGEKISREQLGLPRRKCLLCQQDAAVCGRSRAHSVPQLQKKTRSLLRDAVWEQESRYTGELAARSLLYEVCTTPKPGLVDLENNGSHRDMDIFSFAASTAALAPYFARCARIGMETADLAPEETFARLRFPGKLAEADMFRATGGVNTHKGAVFSMGILCAARGRLWDQPADENKLLTLCGKMAQGVTRELENDPLYRSHSITGARGEAEKGFPTVAENGYPAFQKGLASGLSLNDAGCLALLSMIARGGDTALIHRCDPQRAEEIARLIRELTEKDPCPRRETLQQLDRRFQEENLSPGGCADLLAICYFLHFLTNSP